MEDAIDANGLPGMHLIVAVTIKDWMSVESGGALKALRVHTNVASVVETFWEEAEMLCEPSPGYTEMNVPPGAGCKVASQKCVVLTTGAPVDEAG